MVFFVSGWTSEQLETHFTLILVEYKKQLPYSSVNLHSNHTALIIDVKPLIDSWPCLSLSVFPSQCCAKVKNI